MTSPGGPSPSPARVVMYTREGCHLCDVAREVVAGVCAEVPWSEVDVDSPASRSDGTRDRWTDLVPVVTVDGRYVAHYLVDAVPLRAALAGPRED